MKLFNRKQSVDMSLPKECEIHGIKIEKVPVGKYVSSMQDIQDLPKTIFERSFPDENMQDVINRAKSDGGSFVLDLISKMMITAPELLIELATRYIDTSKEQLMALSPSELLDVLEAWWEFNDLTDFFRRVWKRIKPMLANFQTGVLGSSDGSQ